MVMLNDAPPCDKEPVIPTDAITDKLTNNGILSLLSPQLWAHVLCKITLPRILEIGSISKEIRELVENDIVWVHLFSRDFPRVRIANDNTQNWVANYKKYYKKLIHPLSIHISMSKTRVNFGDTVQMNIKLTNCSENSLNLIVGNITDDFKTGNVLRTEVGRENNKNNNNNNNNSKNKNNYSNKHVVYPICPVEEAIYVQNKSQVITIEKEFNFNLSARLEFFQGNLGLRVSEFSGIFLPLVETQNKVWIFFHSDGIYNNYHNPYHPQADWDFWNGTVRSNKVTVHINQTDPATLPIRVKDYEKKSNAWLSRRLSQF